MRLFVVASSPPQSSFSRLPDAQHDAPAAGPGVAAARPVGERLHLGHQRSRRSGAVGSVTTRDTGERVVGSTKLPTTRSRARP